MRPKMQGTMSHLRRGIRGARWFVREKGLLRAAYIVTTLGLRNGLRHILRRAKEYIIVKEAVAASLPAGVTAPLQGPSAASDSRCSMPAQKFDAWLKLRVQSELRGSPRRTVRNVYVVLRSENPADDDALERTLASLLEALRWETAQSPNPSRKLYVAKRQTAQSHLFAQELIAVDDLSASGAEDIVLFLQEGDLVHRTFFLAMEHFRCGNRDLALIDLVARYGDQAHLLLLPGVNVIHALNCDYFRGRILANARLAAQAIAAGLSEPLSIARQLLFGLSGSEVRRRTCHVPLPLITIGDSPSTIASEREELRASPKPADYGATERSLDTITASVIICTKDNGYLVTQLVNSLLPKLRKGIDEVVIVSNNTTNPIALTALDDLGQMPCVRILAYNDTFNFSKQCNLAAQDCLSDVLIFMNDDITPVSGDWLAELLAPFANPSVGAVGPLLIYPDQRVQHCGMYLGFNGVAGHSLRFARLPDDDYMFLGTVPREVMCVTGAVLAVERRLFEDLNGFDSQLPTSIQDVDLCLRAHFTGRKVVFTPRSVLIHMESTTIRQTLADPEVMRRLESQARRYLERWSHKAAQDPFHNPNYSINDESLKSLRD